MAIDGKLMTTDMPDKKAGPDKYLAAVELGMLREGGKRVERHERPSYLSRSDPKQAANGYGKMEQVSR